MLKPYRTIQDVLASRWVLSPPAERHQKTDRVLRSTKLESSIYRDLRAEDAAMDEIEQDAGKKLKSFPALSQDVFQSFYSLVPRRNEETSLSVAARKFNAPILEHMLKSVSSRFFVGVRSRWAVCVPVTFKTSIPTVQRNWRSATTQSSSTTQTSAKPSMMPFGWRRSR